MDPLGFRMRFLKPNLPTKKRKLSTLGFVGSMGLVYKNLQQLSHEKKENPPILSMGNPGWLMTGP